MSKAKFDAEQIEQSYRRGADALDGMSRGKGDPGQDKTPPPPGTDWPDLIPLDSFVLPDMPPDILPSWAGDFARALSAATETPLELSVSMILAATATAAARNCVVKVSPGYFEPINIFVCCTLEPGNRKSAVQTAATNPLTDWEREKAADMEQEIKQARSARLTAEARIKALRAKAAKAKDNQTAQDLAKDCADLEANLIDVPVAPHLWTSDATPEKLGMLLSEHGEQIAWLSSEGGVFDLLAGRYNGGILNLDLVLKSWSGDAERVDRAGRPPVYLGNPLLTIGLTPQPEVLRGIGSNRGFSGRGLLGRFLFLKPASPLGRRTLEPRSIPPTVKNSYAAGIVAMLNWEVDLETVTRRPVRKVISMTPEAHHEWMQFALHIESTMLPGGEFEHAKDWAGKCPGQAARLAGLLHCIEHAHGQPWHVEISPSTMSKALELTMIFAKHSLATYGLMGADPGMVAAAHVWEWLQRNRKSALRLRDIHQGLRRTFPRIGALKDAVLILEERGYVEIGEPDARSTGRRPSPVVIIRPELAGGWS